MLNAIANGLIILGPIFVGSLFVSINEQRKAEAEHLRLEEIRKQQELQDYANRLYAQNLAIQLRNHNNY